ncbi:MAG: hypothetical protein WBC69_12230 [Geitlerinemataceae cyanobacterium]
MKVKIGEQVRSFSRLLLSLAVHGGMLYFPYPEKPRSTQQSPSKPIDAIKIVTLPPTPNAIESTPPTQTSNLISTSNPVSSIDRTTSSEMSQPEPELEPKFSETETFADQPISTESSSGGETPETVNIDRPSLPDSTPSEPRSELPEKESIEVDLHSKRETISTKPTPQTDRSQQLELKNASREFQEFLAKVKSEEGFGREQTLKDVLQFAGDREALLVSLFCDENDEKISEIIEFRWFSDREPELVFAETIEPNLKNFQIQKVGKYAEGDVYQISRGGRSRYLNIVQLSPDNGTLITIWTQPPFHLKGH